MYRTVILEAASAKERFLNDYVKSPQPSISTPRPLSVETGVVGAAVGSSVVRYGGTAATAVIYAQCAPPLPERESQGYVSVTVMMPFEAVEPSALNAVRNRCCSLASLLQGTLEDCGAYPWEALCVIPKEAVYVLHVEVTILSNDGAVADVALQAAAAALAKAQVPAMQVVEGTLHPGKEYVPWPVSDAKVPKFRTFSVFLLPEVRAIESCSLEGERHADAQVRVCVDGAGSLLGSCSFGKPIPPKTLWECVRRARGVT